MSLSEKVQDLYRNGHISESAMNNAIKQASAAKAHKNFKKAASFAARRGDIFGRYPKAMFKVAAAAPGLGGRLGNVGTLLAGAAALSTVSDLAKKMVVNAQAERTFKEMMAENPELRVNAQMARTHFNVLKQYAPALALNPTVAAGHVRQAIEMGNVIPSDTIKNLAQTQKAYNDSRTGVVGQVADNILGGLSSGVGSLITSGSELI